jgi:NAD(P)-dependent dehydrogenase (short-subunit alcohol dehydrogenase family)
VTLRLQDRVAVVVQSGSELSQCCALRFAEEGASVVVVDPSESALEHLVNVISSRGGTALPFRADAGTEHEIARVFDYCNEQFGRVDVLFINVGALDWWSQSDNHMDVWQESLRLNLLTPIFYLSTFRPLLARSGKASVIFYGSIDGTLGNPGLPAYSAARGGLIPFTHIMADQLGDEGTRVNYIAGAAISPIGPDAKPSFVSQSDPTSRVQATPLRRMATPGDIAGVAAFLASDDSSYVTGSVVDVDGGRGKVTPGTSLR